MLPVRAWRIVYADGSTYANTDGDWADAPPFGVVCVVYYHDPPYVTFDQANEVYVYRGDAAGAKGVKMGLWLDADGYFRVLDLARRSSSPEV